MWNVYLHSRYVYAVSVVLFYLLLFVAFELIFCTINVQLVHIFFFIYISNILSSLHTSHETPDNTVRCVSFHLYCCYFIASDCNIQYAHICNAVRTTYTWISWCILQNSLLLLLLFLFGITFLFWRKISFHFALHHVSVYHSQFEPNAS